MNKTLTLLIFTVLTPYIGFSSHITGSYLSFYSTGINNEYQIDLVVFVDKMELTPSGENVLRNTPMTVRIFSKSSNQMMLQQRLTYRKTENLVYENLQCAQMYRLNAGKYIYSAKVTLPPATYNSSTGYYIAWEYCCRSAVVTNIQRPDQAGLVAYLEFPNLTGQPYRSADINFVRGDYLCVNQPFTMRFPASDSKYRLSYSMTTPLNGHNDGINYDSPSKPAPYPTIQWVNGFSDQNQIRGNPSLAIDPSTGQLNVTPSMIGTYVFSVTIRQLDGNKQVGATIFNFQFPVVDCPSNSPPKPSIFENGQSAREFYKCPDNTLLIYTDSNPDWNHQWEVDGVTIAGATQSQLAVTQAGNYTVRRSFSNLCGLSVLSDTIKVTKVSSEFKPSILSTNPMLCMNDTVYLSTTPVDSLEFIWLKSDKTEIGRGNSVQVFSGGEYILNSKDKKSGCLLGLSSDTISIREGGENIKILLASPDTITLCPGEKAKFAITPDPIYSYMWYLNNTPIPHANEAQLEVTSPGIYHVVVSDTSVCSTKSPDFIFSWYNSSTVKFDSIPPVCSGSESFVVFKTFPKGGHYSLPDIRNDTLYINEMPPGDYSIGYNLNDSYGCTVTAQQKLIISPSPDLILPEHVTSPKGGEVRITAVVLDGESDFLWQPTTYLTSADNQNWITVQPDESITYTVTAHNRSGCSVRKTVDVRVIIPLLIPDIFTPNDDGINDVWEVKNIQNYPNAEQFIYNRWGELVFYNKGGTHLWDGTYKGKKVPPGNYSYMIVDTSETHFAYRGTLLITR